MTNPASQFGTSQLAEICFAVVRRTQEWANAYRVADVASRERMLRSQQESSEDPFKHSFCKADPVEPPTTIFDTLDPLVAALGTQETIAWVASSARVFDGSQPSLSDTVGLKFEYWAKDHVAVIQSPTDQFLPSPAFRTQQLAGFMSDVERRDQEPYEILLTSDVCLNHLQDGTQLHISAGASDDSHDDVWLLDATPLMPHVVELQNVVSPLFVAAVESPNESEEVFFELDYTLKEAIRNISASAWSHATSDASPELRSEIMKGSTEGLAFLKYLTLMTTACPSWQRIAMLPHPASISREVQPGGLVICEDSIGAGCLSIQDLRSVSQIAATGFAQWQVALAETQAERLNRELTIGLVRHEFDRRTSAVRMNLRTSVEVLSKQQQECRSCEQELAGLQGRLETSLKSLSRLGRVVEACDSFTMRKACPIQKNEFADVLREEAFHTPAVNKQAKRRKPNISFSCNIGDRQVDLRLYVMASEILNNARKHLNLWGELWRDDELPEIAMNISSPSPDKVAISCISSPHNLPIADPESCFVPSAMPSKSMKGLGLVRLFSSQLAGNSRWSVDRDGTEKVEAPNGKSYGRYRVTFEYVGPGNFGNENE